MRLVIISHTAHYKGKDGRISGWGPTVREIDFLSGLFDSVVHVAPFYESAIPESAVPYMSTKIEFVSLKPAGGPGWGDKLTILLSMPGNMKVIWDQLRTADWVHVRLPTNLGLYVLPLLSFKPGIRRWIKYAGNWIQKNPPVSYALQRGWLTRNWQRSYVTINGKWPQQSAHLLSFENPCFTEGERQAAGQAAVKKDFQKAKTICFVGVLDKGKGILQLVKSMQLLKRREQIEKLIVVGDGPLMKELKEVSRSSNVLIEFAGYLPRQAINAIYEQAHVVALPSDSEGFPKVIAEGASYGCVPLVTDVSSIGQYVVHGENGFLLNDNSPESIAMALDALLGEGIDLKAISVQATKMGPQFTYERYVERIKVEILGANNY